MARLPLLVALGLVLASAGTAYAPARFQSGAAPAIPADAVGGGEVFVELQVNERGAVTAARPLRTTPPFTEYVIDAVKGWRFTPAHDADPVAAAIMVAAIFRPPALTGPTLGERPSDVGQPSRGVAAPIDTPLPPFPPHAQSDGVVMIEARIAASGELETARVIRSAPPFDDAAMKTVRTWRFTPAQRDGMPIVAYVYVILGFRRPV